jgi:pantoate--beta-alanine ligase
LVRDLNVNTKIHIGATARASDGLALSSRNAYLSPLQRASAGGIYASLCAAKAYFQEEGAGGTRGPSGLPRPAQLDAAAIERLAQSAAFGAAEGAFATSGSLEPLLQRTRDVFCSGIAAIPAFSSVEYCEFSDASTGQRVTRLSDSRARNGAVMMSVVARMGSLRLLDNIMLVGELDDLGVGAVSAGEKV